MLSIWAKDCMLDECVCVLDLTLLPFLGGGRKSWNDLMTDLQVKSSMARSLPVENLLPQKVDSIINYLQ